jgi:hypothetical protein
VDVIVLLIAVIAILPQDGAGRVGKMLFARQGKKFDYDLKQVNMWKHVLSFVACTLPICSSFVDVILTKIKHLQLRFSSDLLLEIGAGIELTTAAFPQFFLPMACMANVVKVGPH